MSYGPAHRYFLRTVMSRGVLTITEAQEVVSKFSEDLDGEISVNDIVKQINEQIKPYEQSIKIANDEYTDEKVVIFMQLGFDEASLAQNTFSENELEYFRLLLEEIMTTEARQVNKIGAMNVVNRMNSFSKTQAQSLLELWCQMRYLDMIGNNFALGVRTIHEFEGYLRQNMPDTIIQCCLCKKVVFRGYNCPACAAGVHTRCLKHYLRNMNKWPCCSTDYSDDQLENMLNNDSSAYQSQVESTQEETATIEETQHTEELTQEIVESQDLIPEISQRVTRKRKRQE